MKPDTQLMDMVSSLTLHSMNGTLNEQGLQYLETLLENNPLAVEYCSVPATSGTVNAFIDL